MFSTLDIAKNEAIQNSLDNLRRCVRFYSMPGQDHNIHLSFHYLRQRRRVAKNYGQQMGKVWL